MTTRLTDRTVAEIQRHLSRPSKKEKTSVSLSGELIAAVDSLAGKAQRSAFLERALRSYLKRMVRRTRNERDLAAINARAAVTNRESDRVLELQERPE
jgi:metal-responsive CopG/Arc/MetJ family transcriptional regulator